MMFTRRAKLEEAIKSASTTAEIKELVRKWKGPKWDLMSAIGEHASVFDDELVMVLLVSGVSLDGLAKNPHLPSKYYDQIVEWLVNRVIGEFYGDSLANAYESLRLFLRNKVIAWNNPAFQYLVTLVTKKRSHFPLNRIQDFHRILLSHPEPPPSLIERIYYDWESHLPDDILFDIAIHPRTPMHIVKDIIIDRRALHSFRHSDVEALVQVDRIRKDPDLRPQLIQFFSSYAPSCLVPFIIDRNPEDCAELFRKLPPHIAADVLRNYGDDIASLLSEKDLLPLIESGNREHRLLAIASLSRMHRDRAFSVSPEKTKRSSARE